MGHVVEMRFASNHLARSDDASNAVWVKSNVTGALSVADPLGGTSAWSVQADSVGNQDNIYQEWTTNASAVRYSCEFYCQAGDADAESDSLSYGFYDQTAGSAPNQTTRILSGPGTIEDATGTQRISGLTTTDWTRIQVNLDAAATATNTLRWYFVPGGNDVTSDAKINIFRPTIQTYPHDSRLLSTTTAVTTTWTDVTADVLMRVPVRWSRGIFTDSPLSLQARPGTLSFALNNHESNSGALAGYYSPGHTNVRSGFKHGVKVRLKVDAGGGVTRYVFSGRLAVIEPESNSKGGKATHCLAIDWLGELADLREISLPIAEDQTADALLQDVVDLVASPPTVVDFDTGIDTFDFAWDDLGSSPGAVSAMQGVLQSEYGYLYLRGDTTAGETLTFENRHARFLASSAATLTESDFIAGPRSVVVPSSLDRIYNDIEVEIAPREVDAAATTILIDLGSEIEIASGETLTITASYRDPSGEAVYVGAKDMVDPVSVTDWGAADGPSFYDGGFEASIAITSTFNASDATFEITNNHASRTLWVHGPVGTPGLQARGRGLYRYATIRLSQEDATSIDNHGRRQLPSPMLMAYQDNQNTARGVAGIILTRFKDVDTVPFRVRLNTGNTSTLQTYLPRDIGDVVTISETQTGAASAQCVIHGLEGEIRDNVVSLWWALAKADTTNVFIFDDATAGKFDTGGVLGWA